MQKPYIHISLQEISRATMLAMNFKQLTALEKYLFRFFIVT